MMLFSPIIFFNVLTRHFSLHIYCSCFLLVQHNTSSITLSTISSTLLYELMRRNALEGLFAQLQKAPNKPCNYTLFKKKFQNRFRYVHIHNSTFSLRRFTLVGIQEDKDFSSHLPRISVQLERESTAFAISRMPPMIPALCSPSQVSSGMNTPPSTMIRAPGLMYCRTAFFAGP